MITKSYLKIGKILKIVLGFKFLFLLKNIPWYRRGERIGGVAGVALTLDIVSAWLVMLEKHHALI